MVYKVSVVIGVHGFNVKDPSKTVGKLKAKVKDLVVFDYGWIGLFGALFGNKGIAKDLKRLIDSNAGKKHIVYSHSNGSAISVKASELGADIHTLVCINSALKVKTKFPDSIKRIIVVYTRNDKATKAADFLDRVPLLQLIIPNAWGAMGAYGYKGDDKRVINCNLTDKLDGHSDFFSSDNIDVLVPYLKGIIDK